MLSFVYNVALVLYSCSFPAACLSFLRSGEEGETGKETSFNHTFTYVSSSVFGQQYFWMHNTVATCRSFKGGKVSLRCSVMMFTHPFMSWHTAHSGKGKSKQSVEIRLVDIKESIKCQRWQQQKKRNVTYNTEPRAIWVVAYATVQKLYSSNNVDLQSEVSSILTELCLKCYYLLHPLFKYI